MLLFLLATELVPQLYFHSLKHWFPNSIFWVAGTGANSTFLLATDAKIGSPGPLQGYNTGEKVLNMQHLVFPGGKNASCFIQTRIGDLQPGKDEAE